MGRMSTPPTEQLPNHVFYGDWKLTGVAPNRKLTRIHINDTDDTCEPVEYVFEDDYRFTDLLKRLRRDYKPSFIHHRAPGGQDPAREKTKTTVHEVHFVRTVGAPLDSADPTNKIYGPIETANDAVIMAMVLNDAGVADEGEEFEAVTRKTTIEETIL